MGAVIACVVTYACYHTLLIRPTFDRVSYRQVTLSQGEKLRFDLMIIKLTAYMAWLSETTQPLSH